MKQTLQEKVLYNTNGGYYGSCRVLIKRLSRLVKKWIATNDDKTLLSATKKYLIH
jgi:hypothetical protein